MQRAAGDRDQVVPVPFSSLHARISTPDSSVACATGRMDQFDCVLVRSMPPGTLEQVIFRMNALAALSESGMPVVNSPRALEISIDKYLALTRLQQAGMVVPRTVVCQGYDQAMAAFEALGRDVVIKPLFGGEGRGLMRVSDQGMAHRALRCIEQMEGVFYLQETIEHEGHDLRIFSIGEKCHAIRRQNDEDWRTNVSQGGRSHPHPMSPHLEELAQRASRAVGTGIAALDLLPSKEGTLYALEINAVPGWRSLARALDVDVAGEVLAYLREQVG